MSKAGSAPSGGKNDCQAGTQQVYRLEFRLEVPGNPVICEPGEAVFREDILSIAGESGSALNYSVRAIDGFDAEDYRVAIRLNTGAGLELYYLGYKYENFVSELTSTRNKYIKQDLLFHEKLLFTAESAKYQHVTDKGAIASAGDCEAQVSETALVLAEPGGNHLKFPLSYASRVLDEDYSLKVFMETGDVIVLSMLGRQREPMQLNIEKAIANLAEQSRTLCQGLFPDAGGSALDRLSVLFKDGRAVSKTSLDNISPGLWEVMEQRLASFGIDQSYDFLKQSGDISQAAIGFKRGLMGELTGEYVWFLVPVPVKAAGKWVIAMEARADDGSGGRATYFYSLPPEEPGHSVEKIIDFIRLLNYNLLMVNFRREPIYLSDEMLGKPAYHQYKYAVERLPSLRLLRSLFGGRVVHNSEEGWKKEVSRIIGGT